jgi:hypothetical protein
MYWNTGIVQDRDGYWVEVEVGSPFDVERMGPFSSGEEAKSAELARRLKLSLDHGAPQLMSR